MAARFGRNGHENFRYSGQAPDVSQQKQRPELPDWLKAPAGLNAAAPKKERPQLRLVVNNTAPKAQRHAAQPAKPAVKAKAASAGKAKAAKSASGKTARATKRKAA